VGVSPPVGIASVVTAYNSMLPNRRQAGVKEKVSDSPETHGNIAWSLSGFRMK
jgi:hypothetical protein